MIFSKQSMKKKILVIGCLVFFISFYFGITVYSNSSQDSDHDGLKDHEETTIYHTNPNNNDTDGDGYKDGVEIVNMYSPLTPKPLKLTQFDYDKDGLNDFWELAFKSSLSVQDTDGDSITDYDEVEAGTSPISVNQEKLEKKIVVSISEQKMYLLVNDIPYKVFAVSTGTDWTPTPIGTFTIDHKVENRISNKYNIEMPYWMAFKDDLYAVHELPFINGVREGEDHLGRKASHGCVRLGIENAEYVYNWTLIGTEIVIY